MKVKVSRDIREDLSMNWISLLIREERVTRLSSIFEVNLPVGCSPPFRVGQSIRLKPSCYSLHVDENSSIEYDVSSGMWNIRLPSWYILKYSFDTKVKEWMDQYGFDTATVIVP